MPGLNDLRKKLTRVAYKHAARIPLSKSLLHVPSEEWFKSHYGFAADTIFENISRYADISKSVILDIGCGDGITDLGLAYRYRPRKVIGIDITRAFVHIGTIARRMVGIWLLPRNLEFHQVSPGEKLAGSFKADVICCWSVFEHIELKHLDGIIKDLHGLLPHGGIFFLQIEPLYYSPFGSHLDRFVKEPWAHLLWSEDKLKDAVFGYREDLQESDKDLGFTVNTLDDFKKFLYSEYIKLNRITADELERRLTAQGFEVLESRRMKVDRTVPEQLLEKYSEEDLLTNEIRLLLRKPLTSR